MFKNRRIKIVEFLISQGFVTEKQIIKVIEEQKRTGEDITSLIVEMGYITQKELTALLGEQIQLTHRKRIGEVLLDQALITKEQLDEALELQQTSHESLGSCLIRLSHIDEETLLDVLGAQLDTPHVILDHIVFNQKMLDFVTLEYMERYNVVPLFLHGNQLTIAMSDPTNLRTRDHLRFTTGKDIDPVIASDVSIIEFIRKLKNNELPEVNRSLDTIEKLDLDDMEGEESLSGASEYGEAVVNIVNNLVFDAIQEKASDIHIEDMQENVRVRFRIDGVLVQRRTIERHYLAPLVSRLKILANMDIAEKRSPQDGKFHLHYKGSQVDVRASTFPTISRDRGVLEKIVLRILDSGSGHFELDNVGFPTAMKEKYKDILQNSNGIILVTGPTGSGKSTTLYSSLIHLQNPGVNIVTMEDPVEYTLEGISQGQIHPKSGFTFASGMRSILRQDPDIIMVGEIRDRETAEMAIQASLTGHLVFSTLHTNDAPSAFTRLVDMDIEPYLITSSVKGIVAQRLVRKICKHCKIEYDTTEEMQDHFGYALPEKLSAGSGCRHCNHTGYQGRIPIFEMLIPDETIESMVMLREPASAIRKYAIENGLMNTLRYHGFQLINEGITTLEEVLMKTDKDAVLVEE